MTYPKKFFWIYLTTITLFLVGLQHMQTLNSSKNSRTCKVVKRTCKKSSTRKFERRSFRNSVIAPIPVGIDLIRHNDFYYSIFDRQMRNHRKNKVVKTKVKVGKNGEVISVRILGERSYSHRKKSTHHRLQELETISSQHFHPGTINGKPAEFWMNIDFRY